MAGPPSPAALGPLKTGPSSGKAQRPKNDTGCSSRKSNTPTSSPLLNSVFSPATADSTSAPNALKVMSASTASKSKSIPLRKPEAFMKPADAPGFTNPERKPSRSAHTNRANGPLSNSARSIATSKSKSTGLFPQNLPTTKAESRATSASNSTVVRTCTSNTRISVSAKSKRTRASSRCSTAKTSPVGKPTEIGLSRKTTRSP